jgi:hypothetical protein
MNIYVDNNAHFHYEVIESCFTILLDKLGLSKDRQIYLKIVFDHEFKSYITSKYPSIIFVSSKPDIEFKYEIYCTFYPDSPNNIYNFKSNQIFISHRYKPQIHDISNIYFLTALCNSDRYIIPSMLPSITKIKTSIPIFAVQGNITEARRNYRSLIPIFNEFKDIPFYIKFIGRGYLPHYLHEFKDKIIVENDLPFLKYHNAFYNVYNLLTLIDDTFKHTYYTENLTSSISYGIAYDIPFICSTKLKEIYSLTKCLSYSSQAEFNSVFKQALDMF